MSKFLLDTKSVGLDFSMFRTQTFLSAGEGGRRLYAQCHGYLLM